MLKLVEIAENYIKSNIHWRVEFTGAWQRTEIPEVPMDAIREALLNSFCYKDYSTGQSNEVAIYKDRIEIYNPGDFQEGFEPQDFTERPIRRNPKIARILYYSKDIESFGTGLKHIADACETAGVRYEFKKLKSGFVVCFYRSEKSTDKVRVSDEKVTEKQVTKTSDNIQKVRSFLEKNGAAKTSEIADYINLSPTRTRVILREMDDVEAVGENKNRRYRFKN